MAMVGVDSGSLYRRTHSLSRLAWSRSAAAWRRSTFIKWTGWTLAMALAWWQHHKHCRAYYYYYYYSHSSGNGCDQPDMRSCEIHVTMNGKDVHIVMWAIAYKVHLINRDIWPNAVCIWSVSLNALHLVKCSAFDHMCIIFWNTQCNWPIMLHNCSELALMILLPIHILSQMYLWGDIWVSIRKHVQI